MLDKLLTLLLDALGGEKNGTPHTCTVPYRSLFAIAFLSILVGTAISSYVPLPKEMKEVRSDVQEISNKLSAVQADVTRLHDTDAQILQALMGGRNGR